MTPSRGRAALLVVALALSGCGAAFGRRGDAGAVGAWSYDVRIPPSLEVADVRVCFAGAPRGWLAPADPEALTLLREAEVVRAGRARPVAIDAGPRGIPLDGLGAHDCVRTVVDLTASGPWWARRMGGIGERVVAPDAWLWAPRPWRAGARVDLTLRLPAGVQASVPWQRRGPGRYRLDTTALQWRSFAAFGRFELETVALPGGSTLEIARLGPPMRASRQGVRRWLETAYRAAAALLGAPPPRKIQIILIPTEGGGGDPVRFGATGRGGGVGVILFPSVEADDDALLDDWVAPHELTHLGLPVVPDADAWMSEGFVTYYTEVLRARVGLRTPDVAWQTLARGLARGQADRRPGPLTQASAAMHQTHSYQRVYWGGAALALTADVELRRATRGRVSLDTALRELARCCLSRRRSTPARVLLAGVSAAAGGDVLRRVVAAAEGQDALPPIERTLARLGVRRGDDGRVTLAADAPDAWIREAITAPVVP